MKKRILAGIAVVFLLLGIVGVSQAALVKIGFAEYESSYYAMIYDDDLQLAWLDYTKSPDTWQDQNAWVNGLNGDGVLTYYWVAGYENFSWTGAWRLPSAGATHLMARTRPPLRWAICFIPSWD